MELQIPILLGAIAIVVVNVASRRLGAPAPLLLVLAGVLVSFLPFVGDVRVEPELLLAGILPPLLYSGAVNMPTMGFRRDFRAIAGLSVVLVVLTALVVGVLFTWIMPGIGLATGIALAAIISPTDAVATALVRRASAPERLVTLLEGESLLNDASALVILRSAVAAIAGSVSFARVGLDFIWAVLAAVVIGFVVGAVSLRLRAHLHDPVLNTAISFVIPFVAYLPTERLGASGFVAVVLAGLVLGRNAPTYLTPQERRSEEANWRTIELLLEGSIFLLIGLELSGLVANVRDDGYSVARALWLGGAGFMAVLAVRAVYLTGLILVQRRRRAKPSEQRQSLVDSRQRLDDRGIEWFSSDDAKAFERAGPHQAGNRELDDEKLSRRIGRAHRNFEVHIADLDYLIAEPIGKREGGLLIWAGMRGAVTMAAAQSLPRDTPQRAMLVLIAFVVATTSLSVQGTTLPRLIRHLGLTLSERDHSGREERLELVERLASVSAAICDDPDMRRPDGSTYHPLVYQRVCRDDRRAVDLLSDATVSYEQYPELRLRILHAQRAALIELRDDGLYSNTALDEAMAILDSDEIAVSLREAAFERVDSSGL